MYTKQELVNFNSMLLQRGAPNMRDEIGYNKPDFSVCKNYYDILNDAQLADLSDRLIKYCDTQLGADKGKMKETANYFAAMAGNTYLDNSISLQPDKEMSILAFGYNPDYISIVKKSKNRKYNPEQKVWYVGNECLLEVLKNLKKAGAECQHCMEYVQENIIPALSASTEKPIEVKINKITVNEKGNNLIISFNCDSQIVSAVKSLINRKYDPPSKSWKIDKIEVPSLIEKLQKISNIDSSELEKYNVKQEQKAEFNIMNTSKLSRQPFKHQIEAGEFLLLKKKAILADEMGGGKTLSSILASNSITGKKLVVCPASLKLNWKKEISFVSQEKIEVINGKGWQETNGWTIVNYDILCKHIDSILNANFKSVIFDECHYGKAVNNSGKPGSKRADMMLQISNKIEYVFLLTGTPITNHTKDIFNALKAINHPLSNKFFNFGLRYCAGQNNGFGWDFNGSSNQNELNEKLQPYMMRRLKKELLDLPEKIRTFIPVAVDLKEYSRKIKEYMENRQSMTSQGEHLVYLNAMRHTLAKEKIQNTIELAENILDQEKQVVIFTCYTEVVKQLIEKFGDIAVKLTGDCNQNQRQQAVEDFQAGNKKIIVCNIIAAGVGITLTASQTVIFNDFDWVPANHAQAEDRIHRIGQKNECNIYYMYADKAEMDEKMAQILERKLQNISKIVDGKEESFIGELINLL